MTAISYATLERHLLAGEERMRVSIHPRTGRVEFTVLSLSRGSGPLGKLLFPLLAPAQRRFFDEQVRCMRAVVDREHT